MVTINLGRKEAVFFSVVIFIFVVAGLAIAFGGNNPAIMGHSAGELALVGSCNEILHSGGSVGDGVYTIDANGNSEPFEVYCDMTTEGGGWTLIMVASDSSSYLWDHSVWSDFKGGSTSALNPSSNSDQVSKAFYELDGKESMLCMGNVDNCNGWIHERGTARSFVEADNKRYKDDQMKSFYEYTDDCSDFFCSSRSRPLGIRGSIPSFTAAHWHRWGYITDDNDWGANARVGFSADIDTSDSSDSIIGLGLRCFGSCPGQATDGSAHNKGSGYYIYDANANDGALKGWLFIR